MNLYALLISFLCLQVVVASNLKKETIKTENGETDIQYYTTEYFSELYEQIYSLLKNGDENHSNHTIVFTPNLWAGFANSFRGLYSTALYALVNGFKLRVKWDSYFQIMSPRLGFLKYNTKEATKNCRNVDTESILKFNEPIDGCALVSPYLDHIYDLLSIPDVKTTLSQRNLFPNDLSPIQVRQYLSRSLFRLENSLLEESSKVFQNFSNGTSIGIQIRTGGKMANNREDTIFFSDDKMYRVYAILDSLLKGLPNNTVMFLSTDSNSVIRLLKKQYSIPIVTADCYSIGHSSPFRGMNSESALRRAAIDLRVLSQCDYLLTTFTSSFGNLASYLSHSLNKIIMNYKD